ncbi:GNAT family N-acetyltransferase [Devosia beringensis]|uniref:GNAT family N-acetyltransferase n=1 Tax=Devosia beringensis TaxID=2657486 RepID=UPI00186B847D|nr:GNAT family N-acetyltransferase [Devosia beringensis]
MTLLTGRKAGQGPIPPHKAFDVAIFHAMDVAEAEWRAFEAVAVLTPYQRFDWVKALIAAGLESEAGLAIAVIRRDGETVALLPLAIRQRFGLRVATMLGTTSSNGDWLMALPRFNPDAATLQVLLRRICQAAGGADLVTLYNQPASWQGMDNPVLALAKAPGASNTYVATIGPTPVPYIEHRLSTKRRNNITRGMRRLAESFGPLRTVRVNDLPTLEAAHQVFLEQRAARFVEMGVRNIFAEDGFVRLFRQLAPASFGQARPALCLHVLYAGEEIVATCWGAMAGNHYSQYINSTSSGPASQYSLMAILIGTVMDDLTQAGIVTMDMGLGDFAYKSEWAEREPVFHSVIALTRRGQLAAAASGLRDGLKRQIKQTPWLWTAAKRLRQLLFSLTRKS